MGFFDRFRRPKPERTSDAMTAAEDRTDNTVAEPFSSLMEAVPPGAWKIQGYEEFVAELSRQAEQGPHDSAYWKAEEVGIVDVEENGKKIRLVRIPDRLFDENGDFRQIEWYTFDTKCSVCFMKGSVSPLAGDVAMEDTGGAPFRYANKGDYIAFEKDSPGYRIGDDIMRISFITAENAHARFDGVPAPEKPAGVGERLTPSDLIPLLGNSRAYSFNVGTVESPDRRRSVDICCGFVPKGAVKFRGEKVWVRNDDGSTSKLPSDGPFCFEWVKGDPSIAEISDDPIDSRPDSDKKHHGFDYPIFFDMDRRAQDIVGGNRTSLNISSIAEGVDLVDCIRGVPGMREDPNSRYAFDEHKLSIYAIPAMVGLHSPKLDGYSKALSQMNEKLRLPYGIAVRSTEMDPVGNERRRVLAELPVTLGSAPNADSISLKGDFMLYEESVDGEGKPFISKATPLSREYVRDNYPEKFSHFRNPELDSHMFESIADVLADGDKLPAFRRISGDRYAVLIPKNVGIRDADGRSSRAFEALAFSAEDYLNAFSFRELAPKAEITDIDNEEDLRILRDASAAFIEKRRRENGIGALKEPEGLGPSSSKHRKSLDIRDTKAYQSMREAASSKKGPKTKEGK